MTNEPDKEFGKFSIPEILSFRQTLSWVLYLMHLPESDIASVAERLAFPTLLTDSVRAASSLLNDLPSFKDWKPSQWTFHLDELPSLSVYAVWLVTSKAPLGDYLTKWQNIKLSLTQAPEIKQLIQKEVDRVNKTLAQVEQVKKFTIIPKKLYEEDGEVTPTMKV